MGIRPKQLLTLTLLIILALVTVSVVSYQSGARALETALRNEVRHEAGEVARAIEEQAREREAELVALAGLEELRAAVQPDAEGGAQDRLANQARLEVERFLQSHPKYYLAVALLTADREPLFRGQFAGGTGDAKARFQTQDFLPASIRPDERVWTTAARRPLGPALIREAAGYSLRYVVPVFVGDEESGMRGALIADLRLDALLDDAASRLDSSLSTTGASAASSSLARVVIVLDRTGNLLYHTNRAFRYQPIRAVMPPSFAPATNAMQGGQSGWQFYEATDGESWLAAYEQIAPLNLAVAVAADDTAAMQGLRRVGWLSVALTALLGFLILGLLFFVLRRTAASIERVTRTAAAIAGGSLDERIEVRSGEDVRLLAESFNAMTERLREQIAREAESRQFESFMRLSAMLTHDLKNSILALSLLVSNMEEQFHREEFRADAMRSLTEATDNLRALVVRLSEPVRSLSGEFKRPHPVDLVPIIRRVVARIVEPSNGQHRVELTLPPALVALTDEERIERVLENLVLNAREALGLKPGELRVEAGPAEDGFVSVSVTDTGAGMTDEFQRTKLFRPFATTKKKGVGLGLYTCRELVRALGGRIEVRSERGSGATFRVVLPSGPIRESASPASRRDA